MNKKNFRHIAAELKHKEVEVITTDGTFTGTLLEVGSDFLVLHSRIRGRLVRLFIRFELIVALFRFRIGRRGPFGFTGAEESESEEHKDESSGGRES